MRDVLGELMAIWRSGGTAAMATVVRTFRSAPRPPGAAMVVGPDGAASGSVSGGCVEGAVYELGNEVIADGVARLQRYGVSDDDAFAVGLTCGGILDVFVEPVSPTAFPELGDVAADIDEHRPVAVATVIAHPDPAWVGRRIVVRGDEVAGTLGSSRADAAVTDDARGLLATGRSEVLTYGPDGERRGEGMEVFVAAHAPRPRMLVFGAIDFAAAVARQGRCSATASPSAMPGRCSPPARGSPPPTRSSSNGRTATWPRRRRRGRSTAAPSSACSPTIRSSTFRCWRWPCGCPRSATSGRWDRGAPTRTGCNGCATPG